MADKHNLVYTPASSAGEFVMVVAKENEPTVDGRIFEPGSITWREPPIPLLFIRENDPTGAGGHKGAFAAGTLVDLWREENTVFARGYFASDEKGQEARKLIEEGIISGVSADVGGAIVEELEALGDSGDVRRVIKRGTIVSVTALPIPAFNDTRVAEERDPITASAGEPWSPPSDWFRNPGLKAPTPLTVSEDGRVYGHAATWGACHVGFRDRCVTAPRSQTNYQYFNVGTVLTADGKSVPVGRLTAGTNHADLTFGAEPARAHYDNSGWAAAYVHTGEDEHGIWFAGSVSPTASPEQVAVLRAGSVSGDWRNIQGKLEMVGLLTVNSPGFPVARAGLVAGAQMSLVAGPEFIDVVAEELGKKKKKGDCGCDDCEDGKDCPDKAEMAVDEVVETTDADTAAMADARAHELAEQLKLELSLLDLDVQMDMIELTDFLVS